MLRHGAAPPFRATSGQLTTPAGFPSPLPPTPPPHPHPYAPNASPHQAGKVMKLGGSVDPLRAYVAVPAGGKPEAAVLIFPDVYGWDFNNTR
jgi:hypothetical protein